MKAYLKKNPSCMYWSFCRRYVCSYLAISMAQSIIRDRLLFFCRSFWRVYRKLSLPFEELKNILKDCEGRDPKIRVIALQFYSLKPSVGVDDARFTSDNSAQVNSCNMFLWNWIPMIKEIFEHNRLRSECLQVQTVGYMFTSFGFSILIWGMFHRFLESDRW